MNDAADPSASHDAPPDASPDAAPDAAPGDEDAADDTSASSEGSANSEGSASDAPPADLSYIVIEGVIGAGKTTLARLLSERLGARLVLEQFEENPFLERFYADRSRWAFQTQLAFLASRFRQQKDLQSRDLFHDVVVSDYAFEKDRIFAHHNLDGDELSLYETLFALMEPFAPTPDLVVYLQSSPERLMQNIAQRGRSYEEDMDPDYIEALYEAYNYFFFRYTKSPLLIVNASEIDFVAHEGELEQLVEQITHVHHHGTTYFTPLPARRPRQQPA